MAFYNWRGRTRAGESRTGVLEAADSGAVAAQLHHMGLVGVRIKPKPRDLAEILPFLKPRVQVYNKSAEAADKRLARQGFKRVYSGFR